MADRYSYSFLEEDKVIQNIGTTELHILDLSPIFYWTSLNLGEEFSMVYVRQLIYQLYKMYNKNNSYIVAFDNKPIKKYEFVPGSELYYKKNRTPLADHIRQHRATFDFAAKLICKELGFTIENIEGYEADDVIYNSVDEFYYFFDKIVIHSQDSDMFFMIDEKVSIDRGNLGIIDINNFSQINKSDTVSYLPYNLAAYYSIYYKNKDNRGRIYIGRFRELCEIAKNIDPKIFCKVDTILEFSEYYLTPNEMNILKLALPLQMDELERANLNNPTEQEVDVDKLNEFYYIACKQSYDSQSFVSIYNQIKEYYGEGGASHV